MKRRNLAIYALTVSLIAILPMILSCAVSQDEGKIPITTKSEKAREYFLQGRDLAEKLRGQESIELFKQAIQEDPDFAMAYLNLAFVSPNAKEFFQNFDMAKALIDKVSEGERLWILGIESGINAFPMKQRELFQKMVEAFPNDERAHNLLAGNYFGQEDYQLAIEEYSKAALINPDFSQPYNQLGYAYRFLDNYSEAEKAFKKYIELIPNDPNPYDSYAELLLKMGKYDKSIEAYRKALEQDPNFVASHFGIATNLNMLGKYQDARKQLQELYEMARNDGERRAAYFAMSVSYVDEGKTDAALEEQNKAFALAEKINDPASMGGDLVVMGNILLEVGKLNDAQAKFDKALEVVETSDLTELVKDNSRRLYLFNTARIALKKGDLKEAKTMAEQYHAEVKAINNPFQIKLSRELNGQIALEEKNYDKAIEELQQASQQNPYNFYRMGLAYQGKGDKGTAKKLLKEAAEWNAVNSLNYSFMRHKAKQALDSI
jgi:tetratricopeptide (TPR) repeat protein